MLPELYELTLDETEFHIVLDLVSEQLAKSIDGIVDRSAPHTDYRPGVYFNLLRKILKEGVDSNVGS